MVTVRAIYATQDKVYVKDMTFIRLFQLHTHGEKQQHQQQKNMYTRYLSSIACTFETST